MLLEARVDGRTVRVEVRGRDGRYTVVLDGRRLEVDLQDAGRDFVSLLVDGRSYDLGLEKRPAGYTVVLPDDALEVELTESVGGAAALPRKTPDGPIRMVAPMPGKLLRILVEPGSEVGAGQGLLVIEAMKMENELHAPRAGRVKELPVREGQAVETGALLAVLE